MEVERFREQLVGAAPRTAVGAWVVTAEDEEEANRLAASSKMAMKLLRRGQLIPVPPVEKALRFLESEGGEAGPRAPGGRRRAVIGTPDQVRAELEALAGDYGADEVIVVTITFDHMARRRSYELLADAFGLPGVQSSAPSDARAHFTA